MKRIIFMVTVLLASIAGKAQATMKPGYDMTHSTFNREQIDRLVFNGVMNVKIYAGFTMIIESFPLKHIFIPGDSSKNVVSALNKALGIDKSIEATVWYDSQANIIEVHYPANAAVEKLVAAYRAELNKLLAAQAAAQPEQKNLIKK